LDVIGPCLEIRVVIGAENLFKYVQLQTSFSFVSCLYFAFNTRCLVCLVVRHTWYFRNSMNSVFWSCILQPSDWVRFFNVLHVFHWFCIYSRPVCRTTTL